MKLNERTLDEGIKGLVNWLDVKEGNKPILIRYLKLVPFTLF